MTDQAVIGRRDRKKAQTRAALRRAALDLALDRGYEHLTVEAITEAADVSTRTFFNYFTSKDDALLSPDPDEWDEIAQGLAARPADETPAVALHAVLVRMAGRLASDDTLWRDRLTVVSANPQLWPQFHARFAAFERLLTESIAARTGTDPDADLYPAVVAATVTAALRVAMEHSGGARSARQLTRLVTEAFDVLAGGLSPRRL